MAAQFGTAAGTVSASSSYLSKPPPLVTVQAFPSVARHQGSFTSPPALHTPTPEGRATSMSAAGVSTLGFGSKEALPHAFCLVPPCADAGVSKDFAFSACAGTSFSARRHLPGACISEASLPQSQAAAALRWLAASAPTAACAPARPLVVPLAAVAPSGDVGGSNLPNTKPERREQGNHQEQLELQEQLQNRAGMIGSNVSSTASTGIQATAAQASGAELTGQNDATTTLADEKRARPHRHMRQRDGSRAPNAAYANAAKQQTSSGSASNRTAAKAVAKSSSRPLPHKNNTVNGAAGAKNRSGRTSSPSVMHAARPPIPMRPSLAPGAIAIGADRNSASETRGSSSTSSGNSRSATSSASIDRKVQRSCRQCGSAQHSSWRCDAPNSHICADCRDSVRWPGCDAVAAANAKLDSLLSQLQPLPPQRRGEVKAAAEALWAVVMRDLCARGHRPRLETWMRVIAGFSGLGMPGHAEAVLGVMAAEGVRPDAVCFNAVANAWCECDVNADVSIPVGPSDTFFSAENVSAGGSDDLARRSWVGTSRSSSSSGGGGGSSRRGQRRGKRGRSAGRVDDALRVVEQMEAAGIPLTHATLNTLVKGLGRAGRLAEAMDLLRRSMAMQGKGGNGRRSRSSSGSGSGSSSSGSSSSSSSSSSRRRFSEDSASESESEWEGEGMEGGSLQPPRVEIKAADEEGLRRTFNMVLNAWCDGGEVEEARAVLRLMRNSGVAPDAVTYNTLMKAYAVCGRPDDCERVLWEMVNGYVRPTERTFALLVRALCEAGRCEAAERVVKRMRREFDVAPNVAVFNTLVKGYAQQRAYGDAERVVSQDMVAAGVRPDVVTHTTLVGMWADAGDALRARAAFDAMLAGNIAPDVHAFSTLVKAMVRDRRRGGGWEAEAVVDEMAAFGLRPNVVVLTTVVSAYCSMASAAAAGTNAYQQEQALSAHGLGGRSGASTSISSGDAAGAGTTNGSSNRGGSSSGNDQVSESKTRSSSSSSTSSGGLNGASSSSSASVGGSSSNGIRSDLQCARHYMDEAVRVLNERMRDAGVPPNVLTFRTVLWGLAEARLPLRAEALMRAMPTAYGVAPDSRCVDLVAGAWQAAGMWREADRFRKEYHNADSTTPAASASSLAPTSALATTTPVANAAISAAAPAATDVGVSAKEVAALQKAPPAAPRPLHVLRQPENAGQQK